MKSRAESDSFEDRFLEGFVVSGFSILVKLGNVKITVYSFHIRSLERSIVKYFPSQRSLNSRFSYTNVHYHLAQYTRVWKR